MASVATTVPPDITIRYLLPDDWITYDVHAILGDLVEAKAGTTTNLARFACAMASATYLYTLLKTACALHGQGLVFGQH